MVFSPLEIQNKLERVLLTIQKPGRYVGGELNQIVKDWERTQTHVALIFPDIYDIGLPNLGIAILYDLLNKRPDVLAERAYSPWKDMESVMRENAIPIYSLESKHALSSFDILGFSLPYETLYSNTLNILDLAGIPLFGSERTEQHPLVIAGGHSTYNPEPMHAFIDAFVIGEGEEVILDVIDVFQEWKRRSSSRAELLQSLAGISGVYVPSLYQVDYLPDGRINQFTAQNEDLRLPITKRVLGRLPTPPTNFLVPSIEVVHNRVAIEIMRGCTRGCRFCQAGMITRPVRERPVSEVLDAIEDAINSTGLEEAALLSLSSSDYTQIVELVEGINQRFAGKHLTVSLPSLRIESFSVDLMERFRDLRPGGGFTIAPEAASERMRRIINKPVSTEQLLETAHAIYAHGWTSIKLYFMIGHPSETIEDVQAISDLCKAVLAVGRRIVGGRAKVHAGIGTFIPKPHTPFQWVSCDSLEQIYAKLDLLKKELHLANIKMTWTDPHDTLLEAWLSRGDRRTSEVIYEAWRRGAKFDAWQDYKNFLIWQDAFSTVGIDPEFYSHRTRQRDERLPWSHISSAVRPAYLYQQYEKSMDGVLRPDCQEQCDGCGILPYFSEIRIANPGPLWKCPEARKR